MPDISTDPKEKAVYALNTYGNSILRLSYAYLHDHAGAEDILQDTLIQLMKTNPVFTSQDHEKAWLFRVAINLCKNSLKSVWAKYSELSEEYPDDQMSSDEIILLDLIKKLPVKYREVIHLFYYEDCTIIEIAKLLQKNESTIRSLLHRAREKLKVELKGDYDFDE